MHVNLVLFLIFIAIANAANALEKYIYNKSKIAIIGLYDANYKKIGIYSDLNKKEYAKRHGYDLFLYHDTLDPKRHPAWSKILAIQRHLASYNWIFWLDADALIMNHKIKLESLVDQNYDLIIASDHKFPCNSGSFLIKNSPWSHDFLKLVYSKDQFNKPHCCWEQDAINYLYKNNQEIAKHYKIILPQYLNSHPHFSVDILFNSRIKYTRGDFIIHFYGRKYYKESLMKEWYEKSLKI